MKWKYTIFLGILIFLVMIIWANAESSIHPLTKGQADTLYCAISGGCGGGGGNGNYTLNVSGNTGTGEILTDEILEIVGLTNISTSMSGNTMSIWFNGSAGGVDTTINNCSVDLSCDPVFYDSEHTLAVHEAFGLWSTNNFTTANISNWDTTYGWGDHSGEGYLTSETDPLSVKNDTDATLTSLNMTGNYTTDHYTCFDDACSSYAFHNGTHLIIQT